MKCWVFFVVFAGIRKTEDLKGLRTVWSVSHTRDTRCLWKKPSRIFLNPMSVDTRLCWIVHVSCARHLASDHFINQADREIKTSVTPGAASCVERLLFPVSQVLVFQRLQSETQQNCLHSLWCWVTNKSESNFYCWMFLILWHDPCFPKFNPASLKHAANFLMCLFRHTYLKFLNKACSDWSQSY